MAQHAKTGHKKDAFVFVCVCECLACLHIPSGHHHQYHNFADKNFDSQKIKKYLKEETMLYSLPASTLGRPRQQCKESFNIYLTISFCPASYGQFHHHVMSSFSASTFTMNLLVYSASKSKSWS